MAKKGQTFNKYTNEFRQKIVYEKIHEGKSYKYLSRKYDIPEGTIITWVYKYNKNDNELIIKKRGRQKQEEIDYKERYEILKKFLDYLREVDQEKK